MTILYPSRIDRTLRMQRQQRPLIATAAMIMMLSANVAMATVETAVPDVVPSATVPPATANPVAFPVAATPATPAPAAPAAPGTVASIPSEMLVLPEAIPAPALAPVPENGTAPVLSPRVIPGTSPTSGLAAPTAAVTPAPGSAASGAVASASGLTQIAMVLLLVIGLIAGMAWLLRRLGLARNPSGTTIHVVSGLNLSNRERVLVLEIADQWIVVGVATGRINTLATMPKQDVPQRENHLMTLPTGKNFGVWLKRTIDQRNGTNAAGNGS